MARVQGVKEKLHSPIYDAFFVKAEGTKTFKDFMTDPRVIRFFVDVQNKTKLETNLQAAGVLPSLNAFEARAMRVVASTFCLPRDALEIISRAILDALNTYRNVAPFGPNVSGDRETALQADQLRVVDTIRTSFATFIGTTNVNGFLSQVILDEANRYRNALPVGPDTGAPDPPASAFADPTPLKAILNAFDAGCKAASGVLPWLIYNSVTTLLVGEKIMIESPTFYFPSGAGVSPGNGEVTNHGEPDPMATFRFSEPVIIEPQQNFRVEILFPQGVPGNLANVSGPLRIWVVLDGYLTRDVQ